jgi:broad specificity phosphatase PhoE
VSLIYIVQHAEKQKTAGDPPLTERGHQQAVRTAEHLTRAGIVALYASPFLRTRQTAAPIAAATGLSVTTDDRLRERMNWDGTEPIAAFLEDWARCVRDRDFVPRTGDSSHRAGARFREFLAERARDDRGPIAVVSHGGITVDLLRDWCADDTLPADLVADGVPPASITIVDGYRVIALPDNGHL